MLHSSIALSGPCDRRPDEERSRTTSSSRNGRQKGLHNSFVSSPRDLTPVTMLCYRAL